MQARRLIVISGQQQAGLRLAQQVLRDFADDKVLDKVLTIQQVLGKEHLAVIYNAWQGFDPDYLAAVGGTIVAGGVLLLLTPALSDWAEYTDPFNQRIANWPYQANDISGHYIQRFIRQLQQADCVSLFTTDNIPAGFSVPLPDIPLRHQGFKTEDQKKALLTLVKHFQDKASIPVVLEADRGRGKSALLGMLAAQLLSSTPGLRMGVTAPSRKTADVIFRHAGGLENLDFYAPDELCHTLPAVDLLLVDEAAAIPSSLLSSLLHHYPGIIFSTTVHGYEGTGRGFALRFTKLLEQQTADWKQVHLKQPVRYAENDPLEKFLFDSLLLNAKPLSPEYIKDFCVQDCEFRVLDAEQLADNEPLLRQVFGLLVLAHYQTRPADLRQLLDGKDVTITVMLWHAQVIATALCVKEGGFDRALAHDIHYALRRPQGHLVPQSLAVHAGIAAAPLLVTQRIMRIVVHPAIHRRGVGSVLLRQIRQDAREKSIDYLSSSFGATTGLISFWEKQGYQPVRIGFSRDASSGSHAVIVMRALSEAGQKMYEQARFQFRRMFPVLLDEPLKDSKSELLAMFPSLHNEVEAGRLNQQDDADIKSFAFGRRGYESCLLAIQKLVREAYNRPEIWNKLAAEQQRLLLNKCLRKVSWKELTLILPVTGKKQAENKIRETIQELIAMF